MVPLGGTWLGVTLGVLCALALAWSAASARAAEADAGCGEGVCRIDGGADADADAPRAVDPAASATLVFFWGVGCAHCEEARPVVEALRRAHPRLRVEAVETRRDEAGRRRFIETMKALGATAVGVPTFVIGRSYMVGYVPGETDARLRAMIAEALQANEGAQERAPPRHERVVVPWLGEIDPATTSLPALTVTLGLADSINPCAMWVLFVLLGILLRVDTTPRMLLYAGTFVVMSGVVYFAFMVAWSAFFELVGLSRVITRILGAALLVMGAVNIKDVFWFKKGVSFVIPEKAKPGLFRRMRGIARAASIPAALGGIAALAFMVNLVELGCTLGLPALYTRVLALRGLTTLSRFAYLALYNVVYVVPLFAIVLVFIVFKRRITMTERVARVLKGISGLLLVVFGLLFIAAPDLLTG